MTFSTGFVLVLAMAGGQSNGTPPRTVESVDLRAYAGTYYEIARFPNRFQTQCAGDVTATYALRADGRIDVINRCRTSAGTMTEARGIAKRADQDASGAKLKVRFAPAILSFIPSVWGDYWILGLGPEYSFAVIGDPSQNLASGRKWKVQTVLSGEISQLSSTALAMDVFQSRTICW